MQVLEIEDSTLTKLAALSQFLIGRLNDNEIEGYLPLDLFIDVANRIGIETTESTVRDLVNKEPLKNLIRSIDSDQVRFRKTKKEAEPETMSVDQSQKIVNRLAKRVAKKAV